MVQVSDSRSKQYFFRRVVQLDKTFTLLPSSKINIVILDTNNAVCLCPASHVFEFYLLGPVWLTRYPVINPALCYSSFISAGALLVYFTCGLPLVKVVFSM